MAVVIFQSKTISGEISVELFNNLEIARDTRPFLDLSSPCHSSFLISSLNLEYSCDKDDASICTCELKNLKTNPPTCDSVPPRSFLGQTLFQRGNKKSPPVRTEGEVYIFESFRLHKSILQ